MRRLLVVEDSPTQAQHLQFLLEEAGFEVEVARNGQEGLDRFTGADFDLVLTDVLMPGLSGYELCRKIKDDPARRHVPVILLTQLSDPLNIVRGIECGADNFIPKSLQDDYLLSRIQSLFTNRSRRAENRLKVGIEVTFLGTTFVVTSDKEQILDLLISTCEDVVCTNRDLRASQIELAEAKAEVERRNAQLVRAQEALEERVRERTAELVRINAALNREAVERRQSEERFRQLVEHAPDAFLLHDITGRLLDVNQRACDSLGYSREELLAMSIIDVAKDWQPARLAEVWQGLTIGESFTVEDRHHRKDGTTFPVEVRLTQFDAGDRLLVLALVRDMTERRRLEEQYRQAQKMEAVGQLAGGVAHDFNNLLTVINGFGDLVLHQLPAKDPLRELIGQILKAGDRAAALTRQLLAFSRQQVLAPKVLNLNAVVNDLEKMLRRLIGEDVKLAVCCQPDLGQVKADPGLVEQVVLNLAVNARDAMPQGGKLTIETRNVELDETYARSHAETRPGRYVLLAISDTGHGMTEEIKVRIFEPFFTTKETGRGTGLGLAMVFGFVKQSEGRIEVYSEPGGGSAFKIYLPRVDEPVATSPSRAFLSPIPQGKETVLVVEDEEAVLALTCHVLGNCGYRVLEAGDGDEAVLVAAGFDGPIDLLITDVVMPLAGGRQLAAWLLVHRPRMKVLYMSGYTDDAIVRHGVLHEQVHFLQKPFSTAALARKVREVLDSESDRVTEATG